MIKKNTFSEKIKQVRTLLNMWKMRTLTIKGKITLLRTKALPLVLFPCSVMYVPDYFIKKIEHLFFDFIWPSSKHHVKKIVLIKRIENGGLNMPDIENTITSQKLTWIINLLDKRNSFSKFARRILGIKDIDQYLQYKNPQIPKYYAQLFSYWFELHLFAPATPHEILNEYVCNNRRILVNTKPLNEVTYCGIEKIYNIFNERGEVHSLQELNLNYKTNINITQYNSIRSGIPEPWMRKINRECVDTFESKKNTI